MPLFYFDIRSSKGLYRDEFGDDFVDLEGAVVQAQSLLPCIAQEESFSGDYFVISCAVRDVANNIVFQGKLIFTG